MKKSSIFISPEILPISIWALGISGFFLNFSSVIAFSCAPILMTTVLGSTETDANILEGTVEGFALIVRAFTGMISDFVGKRKVFISWGYGFCIFSRFLLAPATILPVVVFSRYMEKLGNGLQASPREAFISDVTPHSLLGKAYGLNKAFSMAGSFAGAFFILIITWHKNSQQANSDVPFFLWTSAIVGTISMLVLLYSLKEPSEKKETSSFSWRHQGSVILKDISEFSPLFWKTIGIIVLFKLGYFSGNFLAKILRESNVNFLGKSLYGQRVLSSAVFLVIQNFACALFAYPLGKISDRISRHKVVALGFVFMILSLIFFAIGSTSSSLYPAVIFYGLQLSLQGTLMALLSTTMPPHLHGTGFGIFFFTTGLCVIFSNKFFMKFFSGKYGESITFLTIAVCVAVGLIGLFHLYKKPSVSSAL